MEQHLTVERIANAIMLDTSFKGHYFIVEGIKDSKLFKKFINIEEVRIREAFGKSKVIQVLKTLEDRGFQRKFGVIDSDFRRIDQNIETIDDLFMTDDHDLEVMLFKSRALDIVLTTICSEEKIKKFELEKNKKIRDTLIDVAAEIGYLKLAHHLHDLGLVFKPADLDGPSIKYHEFVSDSNLEFLGHEKLITAFIKFTFNQRKKSKEKAHIQDKLGETKLMNVSIHQLVNGHDLSHLCFLLVKKILKTNNKMVPNVGELEDCLILAVEYEEFKQTKIYYDLCVAAESKGIKLFR